MRKSLATISISAAVASVLVVAVCALAQDRSTGALVVECNEPGAEAFVDGVNYGRPPAKVHSLEPGFHEVVVIAPARAAAIRRVRVEQGKIASIEVVLSPLSGSVTIATEPPGAAVAIDGHEVGVAPVNAEKLSRGKHTITARKQGYETRGKGIVLDYGESLSICLHMRKRETVVSVFSFPSEADVFLDGEKKGLTPIRMKGVKPGKHQLKLVRGGECQLVEEITLQDGDEIALDFTLPVAGAILVLDQGPGGRKLHVDGRVQTELRANRILVPDGEHLLEITGWKGSELYRRHLKMEKGKVFDIAVEPKLELLPQLEGHKAAILALGFAPKGKLLASGSKDGSVRLWDLESRKATLIPGAHGSGVKALAFNADGKKIASGGWDKLVRIWDTGSGKKLGEFRAEDLVQTIAWSGDGKYVAAGCSDGTVTVWNMLEPEKTALIREHVSSISAVTFVEGDFGLLTGSADGRVCLWKLNDWSQTRELAESSPVMAASVSRDGRYLVTGCEDGQVRVRDLGSLDSVRLVKIQPHLIRSLAAGWGCVFAAGGHSERIVLFDAHGKKLIELDDIKGPASALAFGPEGRYLAAGSDSGMIYLWQAQ